MQSIPQNLQYLSGAPMLRYHRHRLVSHCQWPMDNEQTGKSLYNGLMQRWVNVRVSLVVNQDSVSLPILEQHTSRSLRQCKSISNRASQFTKLDLLPCYLPLYEDMDRLLTPHLCRELRSGLNDRRKSPRIDRIKVYL